MQFGSEVPYVAVDILGIAIGFQENVQPLPDFGAKPSEWLRNETVK